MTTDGESEQEKEHIQKEQKKFKMGIKMESQRQLLSPFYRVPGLLGICSRTGFVQIKSSLLSPPRLIAGFGEEALLLTPRADQSRDGH